MLPVYLDVPKEAKKIINKNIGYMFELLKCTCEGLSYVEVLDSIYPSYILDIKLEKCVQTIAENLLYEKKLREDEKGKVRYNAFGIRFNKVWIYKMGGRPVIYEEKELMKSILPKDEYWRIVNYDLNNREYMIDWTHEREWRVPGNIEFNYKDIEVLVPSNKYYKKFIEYCIKNEKLDMLQEINGIVVLNTIFY